MDSNLPATTESSSLPAETEPAHALPALPTPPAPPAAGPHQNITTGLFPMAIGLLVVLFAGLAIWTIMFTTGAGGGL